MNIVICDDEFPCIKNLTAILSEVLKYKNIPLKLRTFSTGQSCLNYLTSNTPDLVFLDIFLPDINGTDLAMKLRRQGHTFKLVFLTTSNEFAQESFQAQASYYLLKPATTSKILDALEACQFFSKTQEINFTANSTTIQLIPEKILSVEIVNRACEITTTTGSLKSYVPFHTFTKRLTFPPFLLVNRGTLINLNHVQRLGEDYFLLNNGHKVLIKSRGIKPIKDAYKQWLLDNI
jgi:DNA-binding LytR/AlgR family response regulator